MSTPEETNETITLSGNDWSNRSNADTIPCPALLSFYNNGLLNPDKDGNVKTADLDKVLESVGLSAAVRKVLVQGADETDEIPESFNLFALRDSKLDHTGSTGIRDPKVNPNNLQDALLQFNKDGRMYTEHFAEAANHAQKKDPGIQGTIIQTLEFTALLEVFGRVDESNNRYVTVDDVKDLWLDGKFPKDWKPRATDEIGFDDVTREIVGMLTNRLVKRWFRKKKA
ncbi:MAG: hypothetical protein F6K11_10695 [Leptolyngbya sp. SIO3F4]|nr:hypothetical protein [Leptolyngbya sp. SIO3F4]